MKKVTLLLAACAFSFAGFRAQQAEACGGAIFESMQAPRKAKPAPSTLVAQAEQLLESGKPDAAVKKALEAFPTLAKAEPGTNAMQNRALRIAALAASRSGGEQSVDGASGGAEVYDEWGDPVQVPVRLKAAKDDATRSARLEWSVKTLRALSAKNPQSPTLEGDLGEALSAVPQYSNESFEKLSKLADQDLLGSPQAYAALAKLRFQQGLTAKSIEAIQRCTIMTKTPEQCGPVVPAPNPV